MPRKPFELIQKDNGRWQLEGLTPQQYAKAMKEIERVKSKERRKAKRTVTPAVLRSKAQSEIKKLGARADGQSFTPEDLKVMQKTQREFQRRFNNREQGISLNEIMSLSSDSRRDRATNRVDDSSGIKQAFVLSGKDNLVNFVVKASDKNGADSHFVKVRFEEWDEWMYRAEKGSKFDYRKAVAKASQGKVSFHCSCEDHQYRYNYMATVGNYGVAPPKEHSFPKIRNPELTGLACKHVLHVLHKLKTPTFTKLIADRFMEPQAEKVGGGSLRKVTLKESDVKKAKKAKQKSEIDAERYNLKHQKYMQRQSNLAKKLLRDNKEIERVRANAKKARKAAEAEAKRADRAEKSEKRATAKLKIAEQKAAKAATLNKDMAKFGYGYFKDANAGKNFSEERLQKEWAKKIGVTHAELKDLLND